MGDLSQRSLQAQGRSRASNHGWTKGWYAPTVAGLGVFAAALLIVLTRWGIGLSPDSATYIAGARGLLEGHGISFPFGGGRWYPTTSWPPFYSIVLALPAIVGVDPATGARWINAGLLGANTILPALLLRRALPDSHWIPLAGSVVFLVSSDALEAHGWAWSDPLFLLLGFLGLLFLDFYRTDRRPKDLVAVGLLVGLSAFTRYAGVAFAVTGFAALGFRWVRARMAREQGVELIAFSTLAALPLAGWAVRNLFLTGTLGGDLLTIRGIPPGDWQTVYRTISLWFVPGRVPGPARDALIVALGTVLLILTILLLRQPVGARSRIAGWVLTFVLVYAGTLLASRLWFRAFNIRDARYYLPIYLSLVLIWLLDLHWLHEEIMARLSTLRGLKLRRIAVAVIHSGWGVVFVAVVALHGVQAAKWAQDSYAVGLGYAGADWHSSELLDYVRSLPRDVPLVSNAYDAIYLLTGRETYAVPHRKGEGGTSTGLDPDQEWAQSLNLAEDKGASFIMFRRSTRRGLVNAAQLDQRLPICRVLSFPEGDIYRGCDEGGDDGTQ